MRSSILCHIRTLTMDRSYFPFGRTQLINQGCGDATELGHTRMKHSSLYVMLHYLELSFKFLNNFWNGEVALAPLAAPQPPTIPPKTKPILDEHIWSIGYAVQLTLVCAGAIDTVIPLPNFFDFSGRFAVRNKFFNRPPTPKNCL